MRSIASHKVEGEAVSLEIDALDERTEGGASHCYRIYVADGEDTPIGVEHVIQFQHGPIQECKANGITNEALLAIVIDRLSDFQAGDFPCEENEHALDAVCHALKFLKRRTQKRLERGVEGTRAN